MPQPRIVRLVKSAEILGVTHQRTPVADQRGADPVSSVENPPHVWEGSCPFGKHIGQERWRNS
jgi:hypothetical protein